MDGRRPNCGTRPLASPRGAALSAWLAARMTRSPARPAVLYVTPARRRCAHDARLTAPPRQPPYASPRAAHSHPTQTIAVWKPAHIDRLQCPTRLVAKTGRAFPERHRERISVGASRGSRNFAEGRAESGIAVKVAETTRHERGECRGAVPGDRVIRSGVLLCLHIAMFSCWTSVGRTETKL